MYFCFMIINDIKILAVWLVGPQIPNGLGTFFGVAQLILYATYYKSTQRQMAERKAAKEVNAPEVVIRR